MIPLIFAYTVIFVVVVIMGLRMIVQGGKFERESHLGHAVSAHAAHRLSSH